METSFLNLLICIIDNVTVTAICTVMQITEGSDACNMAVISETSVAAISNLSVDVIFIFINSDF